MNTNNFPKLTNFVLLNNYLYYSNINIHKLNIFHMMSLSQVYSLISIYDVQSLHLKRSWTNLHLDKHYILVSLPNSQVIFSTLLRMKTLLHIPFTRQILSLYHLLLIFWQISNRTRIYALLLNNPSLKSIQLFILESTKKIFYIISTNSICHYIPKIYRQTVFTTIHTTESQRSSYLNDVYGLA